MFKTVFRRNNESTYTTHVQIRTVRRRQTHKRNSVGANHILGIEKGDTEEQADYFARKVAKLRVFRDENDKMNLDIKQAGGEILLVSQFSLAGTLGKGTGNRPDFGHAELPDRARYLYERVTEKFVKKASLSKRRFRRTYVYRAATRRAVVLCVRVLILAFELFDLVNYG